MLLLRWPLLMGPRWSLLRLGISAIVQLNCTNLLVGCWCSLFVSPFPFWSGCLCFSKIKFGRVLWRWPRKWGTQNTCISTDVGKIRTYFFLPLRAWILHPSQQRCGGIPPSPQGLRNVGLRPLSSLSSAPGGEFPRERRRGARARALGRCVLRREFDSIREKEGIGTHYWL
jgi:hypothetical protein